MKKIIIIFYGLLLTHALFNSSLWGQKPTEEVLGAEVYIKDDSLLRFVNCPFSLNISKNGTDNVTIFNRTTHDDTVINCLWVDNLKFDDVPLIPNDNYKYVFRCPGYQGEWRFCIKHHEDVMCTFSVNCSSDSLYVSTPGLTEYGMLILIVLIIIAGVYFCVRRKSAFT